MGKISATVLPPESAHCFVAHGVSGTQPLFSLKIASTFSYKKNLDSIYIPSSAFTDIFRFIIRE